MRPSPATNERVRAGWWVGTRLAGAGERALASYQRAGEGRLMVGDPVVASLAADNTAEIYCERGYYEEAEQLLRESRRLLRGSGGVFMLGSWLEFLARVL